METITVEMDLMKATVVSNYVVSNLKWASIPDRGIEPYLDYAWYT